MTRRHAVRTRWLARALPVALLSAMLIPGLAAATSTAREGLAQQASSPDQYDDADSNPLRVVSYFVYPASMFLEAFVFRPLHFVMSPFAPTSRGVERPDSLCDGERPLRTCTNDSDF